MARSIVAGIEGVDTRGPCPTQIARLADRGPGISEAGNPRARPKAQF
jgi:hypothetical protein